MTCHLITKLISGHQTLRFRGDGVEYGYVPREGREASTGLGVIVVTEINRHALRLGLKAKGKRS